MLFSSAAEYGIRAMTYLALQPAGKLCGAREISQAEKIPMAFLWKILHNLTRRKLIRSFKGVRGGYELAHPADRILLHDIVASTDTGFRPGKCILGLEECNDATACPLHDTWKELRSKLDCMLQENTLADLGQIALQKSRTR
jgi:Rrf2 family transcriptional regulator, iron-sulfur cluster assembly transcription factor